MITLNNCDELISFLIESYNECFPYCGEVLFQGDKCLVDGIIPNPVTHKIIVPHKSNKYKFVLEHSFNGELSVFIYRINDDRYDQTVGIILPKYIESELWATIKGEW